MKQQRLLLKYPPHFNLQKVVVSFQTEFSHKSMKQPMYSFFSPFFFFLSFYFFNVKWTSSFVGLCRKG